MSELLNAFPEYPDCMFCCDKDLTFDEFNGFRVCTCRAGVSRLGAEAECEQANACRKRVLAG